MRHLVKDTARHIGNDTGDPFQQLYWEALRRQTPAQRLHQAIELRNAVRSLFLANIRHLDEVTQRGLLAEVCYGVEDESALV